MSYTLEQLALGNEIANKLNDRKSLSQFLKYTEICNHDFLRQTLNDVLSIPDSKITTSRAALFNHIIKTDAQFKDPWA